MPINLSDSNDGGVLEVVASGTLVHDDYRMFEAKFAELRRKHPKLRVLFEMVNFHGWDAVGLWDDLKFDFTHTDDVERFAMVGDKHWEKQISAVGKFLTSAEVRYFDLSQLDEARRWVSEGVTVGT